MKIIYIDESGTFRDGVTTSELSTNFRKSSHFVLSALIVDVNDWEKILGRFKALRYDIHKNYSVKKSEHIHAHELVGGSGVWRHLKYSHLTSPKRRRLLKYLLSNYATWPEIKVITIVVDKITPYPSICADTARTVAYENLFNRVDKTLDGDDYIVINDGQEDTEIIKILRKMRAYNTLKTSYAGEMDIRIKSLLEDPLFKYSKYSYYLQAIDHIAYATLHLFDQRKNKVVAKDLLASKLYLGIGVGAAHRMSALTLPGIVSVPAISHQDYIAMQKRALV